MRQFLEPVDAIFGLSDFLALAGRDAGRAVGVVNQNTLITGVNGDLLALAAIAEGSMAATVETSATNFGFQLVDLACQAAQGQALPSHFSNELTLVTSTAELLGLPWIELRERLRRLDVPIHMGSSSVEEARQELNSLLRHSTPGES